MNRQPRRIPRLPDWYDPDPNGNRFARKEPTLAANDEGEELQQLARRVSERRSEEERQPGWQPKKKWPGFWTIVLAGLTALLLWTVGPYLLTAGLLALALFTK